MATTIAWFWANQKLLQFKSDRGVSKCRCVNKVTCTLQLYYVTMGKLLLMPEITSSNYNRYYTQFPAVQCRTVGVSKQAWVKDQVHVQHQYYLKMFFFPFCPLLLISVPVNHTINDSSRRVRAAHRWKIKQTKKMHGVHVFLSPNLFHHLFYV